MSSELLSNAEFWEYYDLNTGTEITEYPEVFMDMYNKHRPKIESLSIDAFTGAEEKAAGTIRFVVISDTHCQDIRTDIPEGDVLLHCGDFTYRSSREEFLHFNSWINSLPHPTKIVIAGNHDRFLEENPRFRTYFKRAQPVIRQELLDMLTNVQYIQDEEVIVHGYKVYGSPWTPVFCGGFQKSRGAEIMDVWNKVPGDTDILLTHGPPVGCGDCAEWSGTPVGCVDLLHTVQRRVKPLYHCYGHIHEGNGVYTDGVTTFINAALCDRSYRAQQNAYVFDLPQRDDSCNSELN